MSKNFDQISQNRTNQFLSPLQPAYGEWLIYLILETVFLAVGVYFLLAFLYFTQKTVFQENSCYNLPGEKKFRQTRNILLCLLIFYTSTSLMKFCLAQWTYWGPPVSTSTKHCVLIGQVFQAGHSLGSTSLFLFLWLRQHSLQQGNLLFLSASSSHILRFSWVLFVIILVGGLAATIGVIFSNYPEDLLYISGTNACSYTSQTSLNSIIVYAGYSLVVFMQGCILFLFVYILRKSEKESRIYRERGEFLSQTSVQVRKLIRSCTIATAISTLSNVTVVLIDVIFKGTFSQLVVNATWDIDNIISLLCLVFCFTFWKALLLPWPCVGQYKKETTSDFTQNQETNFG